jgi:hypothetical protein
MVEVLQCMIISLPTSHEEITADCRNANVNFQLLLLKKIHEVCFIYLSILPHISN